MNRDPFRLLWPAVVVASLALAGRDSRADARPVSAQSPAQWPRIELVPVAVELDRPVHVTHAGDGSGRLFVVEQGGRVRIVKDGRLLARPFLDISDRVGCCGERGLLSVAFPPEYARKRYFYVDYTDEGGDTVIARYRVTADPDVADPGSERAILRIDQPYANHNGGQLAFGPNDGYLYIGMGDGGSAGDPQERAQDPAELLGKLLRIDVESVIRPSGESEPSIAGRDVRVRDTVGRDLYLPLAVLGAGVAGPAYRIPTTNPYTQTNGYRGEIWALGLRNPWRFSFDRQTGDLYVADVGQGRYEEIDFQPAASPGGENYGWDFLEGDHCFEPQSGCTPPDRYVPPVAEYDHSGGRCSVTGGFVYRGTRFPEMQGVYFYADYCSGEIWGLRREGNTWQTARLDDTDLNVTSFGEDQAGELYLADHFGGTMFRIESVAGQ